MAASQKPIVLWDSRRHTSHAIDDAGLAIKKSVLAPPVRAPLYTAHPCKRTFVGEVPSLAYFCVKTLSAHCDQLHALGHFRCSYRDDIVRALLPTRYKCQSLSQSSYAPESDTLSLDPRLWSTLAQVMHPLPEQLHDLELPLGDIHLPLLQQIPSTADFSLVTLLTLPNCKDVCDDTISELRRLNGLVALDLRGTNVSAYGIAVLVRGLSWSEDDAGLKKRAGLWALRILSLHSCTNIDNKVFPALRNFPLLSAIDLRFTRCSGAALRRHLGDLGFRSQCKRNLFHPAPLSLALRALENIATNSPTPTSIYSCPLPSVFRIHVNRLFPSSRSRATASLATPSVRHPIGATNSIRTTSSFTEDTVVFMQPINVPSLSLSTEFAAARTHKPVASWPFLTAMRQSEAGCSDASEPNRGGISLQGAPDVDRSQLMWEYKQAKQSHEFDGREQGEVGWKGLQNDERNYRSEREKFYFTKSANEDDNHPGAGDTTWYQKSPEKSHGLVHTTVDTTVRSISHSLRRVESPLSSCPRSSFYQDTGSAERLSHSTRSSLPRSAHSTGSPDDCQSDPLAVARPPPSWDKLHAHIRSPHADANTNSYSGAFSSSMSGMLSRRPALGDRSSLGELDHARLSQRNAGAVSNMLDTLASKKFKIENRSSDCLKKQGVKPHNPFAKSAMSAFVDHQPLGLEIMKPGLMPNPEPRFMTGVECGHVSEASSRKPRSEEVNIEIPTKPWKPITTLKVPVLPRKFLPSPTRTPRPILKPKETPKQTRPSFPSAMETIPKEQKKLEKGARSERKENYAFDWARWSMPAQRPKSS
ncbi:hypothetical protein F5I97DRAFT_1924225 [Phlebopus sp. FC_14]|nr:hypothetical protein F5I97DRAFT_1924225 [Phlebopus sp. FC_14]